MVAEGVKTSQAARLLAGELQVSAPITKTVCRIIDGETSPRDAVTALMTRSLKEE
jgi:glycerol-3-phosphate dehydrogenase (NAD(P)+)